MDIQLKKELISINETVMRDNTQILVQSDIIVPDIKSDMAKILQVDSCAMVENVVTESGAADISGKISLNILYVPEGDTKPVCSIDSALPFTTRIENSRIQSGAKCISSADVCHVEFSMINSRKLSVKIVVELDTRCIHESSSELVCDATADGGIEKSTDVFSIYNLVYAGHSRISVSETLDFPSSKPGAICALKTDAKIADKEIRLITGKIVVKGNINVCTLYVSTDNSLEFCEHEIPFTEVLEAEGVSEDCMCDIDLSICDTSFALRPDSDGDMRLIDIGLIIDADINVTQNTNMSALGDCFCPKHNLVCESKPFRIDTLVGCGKAQEALRKVTTFPENAPELVSVYNLITKPYISSVTPQNGKVLIGGTVDCYILYLSASNTAPASTQKTQIDFEIPVEIAGTDESCDCDVKIDIAHQSYNITMTGEVEVRVSVIACAKSIRKEDVNLITNAYIDEDVPPERKKGIVIYFVQPGDTLWKIAKKYRVPVDLIASINRLENPDVIDIGQRLLIP